MSKRILLNNYLMRFGVTFIERFSGLILVPILIANIGLEGYGYYALSGAIILIFTNIISIRFPMAMIRFYPDSRDRAGQVVVIGLIFWSAIAGVAMLALYIAPGFLSDLAFSSDGKTFLLLLTVLAGLLGTLYEFVSVTLRAENRFGILSLTDSGERVLFICLCFIAFASGYLSIESVMAIFVVTTVMKILIVLVPSTADIKWERPAWSTFRSMFAFCLPFLPYLASIWLIERGSMFLVAQKLGERATGVFMVAFTLASILGAVVVPLQTTLYPMLRKAYDSGQDELVRDLVATGLRFSLAIGVLATISICVGTRHLLTLLDIEKAIPPVIVLFIMALVFIMSAIRQVIINVLHITNNTGALLWIAPAGAIAALGCVLAMIDRFALPAVALAILTGTLVQVLGIYIRAPAKYTELPRSSFFAALTLAGIVTTGIQVSLGQGSTGQYILAFVLSSVFYVLILYHGGGVTEDERIALKKRLNSRKIIRYKL